MKLRFHLTQIFFVVRKTQRSRMRNLSAYSAKDFRKTAFPTEYFAILGFIFLFTAFDRTTTFVALFHVLSASENKLVIVSFAQSFSVGRLIAFLTLSGRAMKSAVCRLIFKQLQIFKAVVRRILVLVVNNFPTGQETCKVFFHYQTVLKNIATGHTSRMIGRMHQHVPLTINYFFHCVFALSPNVDKEASL